MTVTELQQRLHESRKRLLAAIAGVTEDQFKRRPAPSEGDDDPWSIAEILAHLLQQEQLRAERISAALKLDGAAVTPSAPESHQEGARAGRRAPVPQLIHGLLASRRRVELLLNEAGAIGGGLERHVLHPNDGRQSIAWMVEAKVIQHELEHVAQIEALRARVGAGAGVQSR
jgi:hypothetical protein